MTGKKEKLGNGLCHVYLIILSVIALFPLLWVLLCSVKSSGELTEIGRASCRERVCQYV